MTANKSFQRLIATTAIVGAFALGLMAAKMGDRVSANDSEPQSQSRLNQTASQRSNPKTLEGKSWQEAKVKLIRRWEVSPSTSSDFPLHEESYALLEKVSVADLEKWFLELNSNFDDQSYFKPNMQEILLLVLAHRSPEHLIEFLSSNQKENLDFDTEDVMDIWIDQDPIAALAWLDKGDIPYELREDRDDYIEDAIVKLAVKDPAEFEKRLAQVSQDLRESILEDYAYYAGTALGRAALLERASQSKYAEAIALWRGLLRREGENQPDNAYASLQQLAISEEDRVTLDIELLGWSLPENPTRGNNGASVMLHWLEQNPQQPVPTILSESYIKWFSRDREGASDWIINQLPKARYDTFAKLTIERRVNENVNDFPVFAKIAGRISDSATRSESQRLLKESWQSKDHAAATEWEKNLPTSEQEKLK